MTRTVGEWVRWRAARIPRKLGLAAWRAGWLYRDVRNAWRIVAELRLRGRPISDVTRYERRIDSQNGEDGILEAIFAKIGTTNRYFVEFGSGNLSECNTVYLARWKGWHGLWMDAADPDRQGMVRQERVTAENIEALFRKYGVPEAPDLLSIDIDGNDYWVWKAIVAYQPRVVVIEYNPSIPPTKSVAIAYDPAYMWGGDTDYYGASLLALQKLGQDKGYTLIGCDSSGTNAFFVRSSLAPGNFIVHDVATLYRPPVCFEGEGHPHDPVRTMIEVP